MKCRMLSLTLASFLAAGTLSAQDRAPLTLGEAIRLAERNSPTYLQQLNDLGPANWGVRAARAGLFLPTADASFFTAWQDQGEQRFGAFTSTQPAVLLSSWNFNLRYTLNGTTLFRPGQRTAERKAVEARIDDAGLTLRTQVTSAYVEVLRLQDRAEQASRELRRSQEHLRLAQAREEVGAGTRLETMQAEVARGRAEIDLIQARNAARVAKLRLVHALGVPELPADRIDLVSEFRVFEPQYSLEDLLADALNRHPSLASLRASRQAVSASVKVAKSAYLPSLSLQANWSGFAREETNATQAIAGQISSAQQNASIQLQSCNQLADLFEAALPPAPAPFDNCSATFAFTADDSASLATSFRQANDQFPFSFQNEPLTLNAFVSIPIFNGFDRQLQVEQAVAQRNDLMHRVRGLELQIRADVTEAVHNLETAQQTVRLQEENTTRAQEELRLARERYQLGAGTFLELLDSETLATQAEVDQIESVYAFHQALTALEAAVGRPLQLPSGE